MQDAGLQMKEFNCHLGKVQIVKLLAQILSKSPLKNFKLLKRLYLL